MNEAFLNIGSNRAPYDTLRECIDMLRGHAEIVEISSAYESPAIGPDAGASKFVNAAVAIRTEMDAPTLRSEVLKRIEAACGRDRRTPGVVALDIDITAFNDESFELGKRRVPDPAIQSQIHVALPLSEIAPDFIYRTTGESISEIVNRLRDAQEIVSRPDIDLGRAADAHGEG